MDRPSAENFVASLYRHVLGRTAAEAEFTNWVEVAMRGEGAGRMVEAFFESEEYRRKGDVRTTFPLGHYHSPVVDPATVRGYLATERRTRPDAIPGIELNVARMRQLWLDNLAFIQSTPFRDAPSPDHRYNYVGGPYPWGDAIILRMMIGHYRPQRIVEIGSGYSTACMLDSAEHAALPELGITCVEPYPDRLRSLLRETDDRRVTIIERNVQLTPPDLVDALQENDFLFIDSSHVMKTGSDVHYELFHLLPRLRPGVIIHIHDVAYPFEYPDAWIFDENYSWNEAYALRAFLTFNDEFRVLFWNSLFAGSFSREIAAEFPTYLRNPGSAIWIERSDKS